MTDADEKDPLLRFMKDNGIPLTRSNYLSGMFVGPVPDDIPAEIEASLPKRFQQDGEEMKFYVAITDFLTDDEIDHAAAMWTATHYRFTDRLCDEIIQPNLARINQSLTTKYGQAFDPTYLAQGIELLLKEELTVQ